MNFDLKHEDFQAVKFHLLIDILANLHSIEEFILDSHCKQNKVEYKDAKEKFEKMTAIHRRQIHDIIDVEFGSVDLKTITK